MMSSHRKSALPTCALMSATALLLSACSGDAADGADANTVELSFATSFPDDHPHNRCGAFVIQEKINNMDIGLNIEVFTNSTLGADVPRFQSLVSGDIDMDLQGPSGLSATYDPIGVLDSAYVFEGADHIFEFFDSGASEELESGLLEATGTRSLEPFFFGMRTFSANSPIRTPEDLEGVRMRFPDTPAYLRNAEALGAEPVAVAFEELYLALQQGIVDGQENPVPTFDSLSLEEVQDYVSLNYHQAGLQLVLINEEKWQSLSTEQQEALQQVVTETRAENRECIDQAEEVILAEWEETGAVEVIEDVDIEAFSAKAEEFFRNYYTGADLAFYEAIRESAPTD
jgi:TRAP-type transport system periplasmic protein